VFSVIFDLKPCDVSFVLSMFLAYSVRSKSVCATVLPLLTWSGIRLVVAIKAPLLYYRHSGSCSAMPVGKYYQEVCSKGAVINDFRKKVKA